MTDLAPLHRRLRRALELPSLLMLGALAPACEPTQGQEPAKVPKTEVTKTETKTETKAGPTITVTPDAKPDTKVVEPPPPPPPPPEPDRREHDRPTCPIIEWCGSRALVESMRATLPSPPADVEGCPSLVDGNAKIDWTDKMDKSPPLGITGSIANLNPTATKAKRAAGDTDTCCYDWMERCPGGRPLLIDGRPWIAGLRAGRSWLARLPEAPPDPALPDHVREHIAEGWLRDALTEHASIASFARARAELQAIDAPTLLLEACERAAEDEVEHARLCFALAERFGDRALEPTALPEVSPRSSDPVAVALDTFVEGCVGETIAAACARRAASLATDPIVRAVLERIADDETEHAALAWRTIAWLTRRNGPQVLAAITRLADTLRPHPAEDLPAAHPSAPQLLAHGRLDRRTLAQTQAMAWRELVDPLLEELHGARPRRRPTPPAHPTGPAELPLTPDGPDAAPIRPRNTYT